MSDFEFSPSVFAADAIGEPGKRVFYLQSTGEFGTLSFLVEKEQVAALAEKLRELLVLIDREDAIRAAEPSRDPALSIEQPVEPEWRIGTIGLAYDEDGDQIVVLLQPAAASEEQEREQEPPEEEGGVRFLLRRDQARAFALHALAVVAEGRPLCRLCGLPIDPEGHWCPASNGHRLSS